MSTVTDWPTANQRYLTAALATLKARLERQLAPESPATAPPIEDEASLAAAMSSPPALALLGGLFGLSPFEEQLVLLCAGIELDGQMAPLCAALHGDAQRPYVTFSLALALLPAAHWSALSPAAALRRWQLIHVEPGRALVHSPLRLDERVLHYLTGVNYLDEPLAGWVRPLTTTTALAPSQQQLAEIMVAAWSTAPTTGPLPVMQLWGAEVEDKRAVAAAACAQLGMQLYVLPAATLPTNPSELQRLQRLWEREATLSNAVLLLDGDEQPGNEAVVESQIVRFLENSEGATILTSRERYSLGQRVCLTFEVQKPAPAEQQDLWHSALGQQAASLNGQLDQLVTQFNFNTATIIATWHNAQSQWQATGATPAQLGEVIWEGCRRQARPQLDQLAQAIDPVATWADLILPAAQLAVLQEVTIHVRQRRQVYDQWGFATKSKRGLGISALFAGASGTGKTLAAEVLANALRLNLYRIDLSAVVSKYIGETEKNLRRIFDAAEAGGVILLFDEADALFGKRSQVKDSHDRYANIEVSYLLQRMEAYRGLAILTTNMKEALDNAFLRRLRFVVQFPFPDATQRAQIWGQIFPATLPTAPLDLQKLARLNIAGGNIRNIALNAAFLAADAGEPVGMAHLLRATQREYMKLERSLTDSEIKEWV